MEDGLVYGYGPYIREMNLWFKHVESVMVIAPLVHEDADPIDLPYKHPNLEFVQVPAFNLTSVSSVFHALGVLPGIFAKVFRGMKWAEHIHLRCPGNMGLVGCVLQTLFPRKKKTAKYAANWDWNSKQSWSYRLQQRLLRNTFLTRNMQAMVYGDWSDKTRNIRNFFTATYHESEKEVVAPRSIENGLKAVFVGRLIDGKKPRLAVNAVNALIRDGVSITLEIIGDGPERESLERKVEEYGIGDAVSIRGNVDKEAVKQSLCESHLLLFPTVMAEGWPKVVAEAMFWGCVPITTRVSCVPEMLGQGNRGTLIDAKVEHIIQAVMLYLNEPEMLLEHSRNASDWSRQFTLEEFETKIVGLLN